MENPKSKKVLSKIKTRPVEIGRILGFNKLTDLNNDWIVDMIGRGADKTLQSHRGSYKTTCLSIAISLIMVIYPNDKILFMRKTNSDVIEVITQVRKILQSEFMRHLSFLIWGIQVELVQIRADSLTTNLAGSDPRGTPQLLGLGIGSSLTGKHFDRIFTDDIVNVDDRISKAERERTKTVYQELQNIKNKGGRIYNTGTPWHADDCFSIMPAPVKYDCYNTGLLTEKEIENLRSRMSPSLFAANYELRHIASEDVIFSLHKTVDNADFAQQGESHVDAAYGGSDFTAFTICNKKDGKYYILGKLWHKHVDDCIDDIIAYRNSFMCGRMYCEDNGDKGYLGKAFKSRGERVKIYHESMNKYIKISTYLRSEWDNVFFVPGTDEDYIKQITDYNENAEHDDAPDSLASIIRVMQSRGDKAHSPEDVELYGYLT